MLQDTVMENNMPIDAVVTWVDGDDPIHRAKRMAYVTDQNEHLQVDVAGETRYRSLGEIAYCIASINKYAPWIRKIYIITDNQNPNLDEFLERNFPEGHIPMEIVDHKVIFRGYERYLPTFNSISIENMMWRIPGLSDHFIYFNDDLFLLRPVSVSDFFENGAPVANGYWHLTFTAKLLRSLRRRKNGHKAVTFRDAMMKASDVLGMRRFFRMVHTPHPFRRTYLEKLYTEYPNILEENIKYRFRDENQYSACGLFYCYTIPKKVSVVTKRKNHYFYISPGHKTLAEVRDILQAMNESQDAIFCCINSLDAADREVIDVIVEWLNDKFSVC